jgi:hypothetical protein
MFKQIHGRQMPVGNAIEKLEIFPASLGGGFILSLHISGKAETMVFATQRELAQALFAMFNAASINAMAAMAKGEQTGAGPANVAQPPVPESVTQDALKKIAGESAKKKRGGRPKLSEEEKASRKAARAAKKANGVDHGEVHASGAEDKAAPEVEVAAS